MSNKFAVVVLTEHQQPQDRGRMVHALHLAQELHTAGADVRFVFCGKSVEWLPQLCNPHRADEHPFIRNYGGLFDEVRDRVVACNMCTVRFGVRDQVSEHGIPIEGDGTAHMKLSELVLAGYQMITL